MPRVPARLAAGSERLFGRPVEIRDVQSLSDGISVLTLSGSVFASDKAQPGAEVEFRVAPTELRHYTLATVVPATGTATLVLHTRGDGPGRSWARALRRGQALQVLGPGGRPPDGPAVAVLGDVTAVGLAIALRAQSGPRPVAGAVEVHPGDTGAATGLLPGLDIVPATAAPGTALAGWLRATPALRPAAFSGVADQPGAAVHLAGHAQTSSALRAVLRGRGMPRRLIRVHAYWADGKAGL